MSLKLDDHAVVRRRELRDLAAERERRAQRRRLPQLRRRRASYPDRAREAFLLQRVRADGGGGRSDPKEFNATFGAQPRSSDGAPSGAAASRSGGYSVVVGQQRKIDERDVATAALVEGRAQLLQGRVGLRAIPCWSAALTSATAPSPRPAQNI